MHGSAAKNAVLQAHQHHPQAGLEGVRRCLPPQLQVGQEQDGRCCPPRLHHCLQEGLLSTPAHRDLACTRLQLLCMKGCMAVEWVLLGEARRLPACKAPAACTRCVVEVETCREPCFSRQRLPGQHDMDRPDDVGNTAQLSDTRSLMCQGVWQRSKTIYLQGHRDHFGAQSMLVL